MTDRISIRSVDAGPLAELFPGNSPDLWAVSAETASGEVYLYARDLDEKKARKLADLVRDARSIDLDLWTYWRTVYGSAAYEAEAFEASLYAEGLRNGAIGEHEVPDALRALL